MQQCYPPPWFFARPNNILVSRARPLMKGRNGLLLHCAICSIASFCMHCCICAYPITVNIWVSSSPSNLAAKRDNCKLCNCTCTHYTVHWDAGDIHHYYIPFLCLSEVMVLVTKCIGKWIWNFWCTFRTLTLPYGSSTTWTHCTGATPAPSTVKLHSTWRDARLFSTLGG